MDTKYAGMSNSGRTASKKSYLSEKKQETCLVGN